ncbi:MAG: hypothetical protein ACKO8Q_10205 [Bacteroidota bacterium]|jgi:hypothetical protein
MRNIILLLSLISLFGCASAPESAEELGKAIYEAVKSKDEVALKKLYLKESEYQDIISESNLSEDKKNIERGKAIGLDKNMEGLSMLSMEAVHRISERYSIDWSKTTFKSVQVIPGNEFGIEGAHYIDVLFDYNGFTYVLNVSDSFKTKNGWKTFKELSMSNYN